MGIGTIRVVFKYNDFRVQSRSNFVRRLHAESINWCEGGILVHSKWNEMLFEISSGIDLDRRKNLGQQGN